MKTLTMTRLEAGLLLGSRAAAAHFAGCHEDSVRRHSQPVACDIRTRASLYDLDKTVQDLRPIRRRVA